MVKSEGCTPGLSTGVIVGSVLGSIAAAIALLSVGFFFGKRLGERNSAVDNPPPMRGTRGQENVR